MITRTIYCERRGCDASFAENHENQGFPGWAQLIGDIAAKDANGHELSINLCPDCKEVIMKWLSDPEG